MRDLKPAIKSLLLELTVAFLLIKALILLVSLLIKGHSTIFNKFQVYFLEEFNFEKILFILQFLKSLKPSLILFLIQSLLVNDLNKLPVFSVRFLKNYL